MSCPQCNAPLPETALQCPQCGADVAWYLRKPDGAEYGPYDLATVDLCLREARIGPADLVRIGAQGEYRSAQHLLGDRFPKLPPPVAYYPAGAQPAAAPSAEGAGVRTCLIVVLVLGAVAAFGVVGVMSLRLSTHRGSKLAHCQSNLKQLGLGMLMYCQDYDERFPTQGNWPDKLNPYLKNTQLWTCPTKPREPGYRVNDRLSAVGLGDVSQPAFALAMWDAGARLPGLPPLPNATPARHNGGDNFAFTDGHVKWFRAGSAPGNLDPRSSTSPPFP